MQRLSRASENEFTEYHITIVWSELHDRFGFDIKKWKIRFSTYCQKHPQNYSIVGMFNRFGYDEINPVLNKILCRNPLYPTFNNLQEYVVRSRHPNK